MSNKTLQNQEAIHESNGTSIQATLPPSVPGPLAEESPTVQTGTGLKDALLKALTATASLRITVVLFVFSILLVFFGTLAQKDAGIWTVVNTYFRTGLVWIPMSVLTFFLVDVPVYVPYPGGWLLGGLLLANLLAAHAIRFKMTWKRSGIFLIHAGLIVMMLSELITGLYAIEGSMTLLQGDVSNYLEHQGTAELAIIHADSKGEEVTAIPEHLLRRGGLIKNDLLPFDVEVVKYMVNSAAPIKFAGGNNLATRGDGLKFLAQERPEVSGTDPEQKVDLPSAYLRFQKKGDGQDLGTFLVSIWFSKIEDLPQVVRVADKDYQIYLRFKRSYKPYSVHLVNFRHDVYPGTDKPKNYSSLVRMVDPTRKEDREYLISMNNPLRFGGETFFQSGVLPGGRGTILQVVRNPGWLMPYISCAMVSIGMLIHFGLHLMGFLQKVGK